MLPQRRNVIVNNSNNAPIMIEDEETTNFEEVSSNKIQRIIMNHQSEQKPIKYIDFT